MRDRLRKTGMNVHVVNSHHAALIFSKTKRFGVALIDYSIDSRTNELVEKLRRSGIQCVYTVAPHSEGMKSAHRVCERVLERDSQE